MAEGDAGKALSGEMRSPSPSPLASPMAISISEANSPVLERPPVVKKKTERPKSSGGSSRAAVKLQAEGGVEVPLEPVSSPEPKIPAPVPADVGLTTIERASSDGESQPVSSDSATKGRKQDFKEEELKGSSEDRRRKKVMRQRSRSLCDPQQDIPPLRERESKGKTIIKKRGESVERDKEKDKPKERPKGGINRRDIFFSGRMSMAWYESPQRFTYGF